MPEAWEFRVYLQGCNTIASDLACSRMEGVRLIGQVGHVGERKMSDTSFADTYLC